MRTPFPSGPLRCEVCPRPIEEGAHVSLVRGLDRSVFLILCGRCADRRVQIQRDRKKRDEAERRERERKKRAALPPTELDEQPF